MNAHSRLPNGNAAALAVCPRWRRTSQFKQSCRSTATANVVRSSLSSIAAYRVPGGSALASAFRRLGLKPKLTPTTGRNQPGLYALASGTEKADALIEKAVELYLTERVPQLKAGRNTAAELASMFWAYRDKPLSALAEVCKVYRAKATKANGQALSAARLRNRIRYLTAACRYAWREHGLCDHDPAAAVTVPSVRNERQTYGTRADMLRACRECRNRTARMAIRIAFYSGMRLSEMLRAEVRGNVWVLADTKNGKPRLVPIHPRVAVCARHFEPGPKVTIQRAWEGARNRAGLHGMRFHDWRHSAASALINAGVDLYTVGRVLGHKDARSTARYSHLAVDALAAAVGLIGQKSPATRPTKRPDATS